MKQSDLITVVMIAVIGTIVAFALVNLMLGNPDDLVVNYKTVSSVNNELMEPDPEVFNSKSINPTVEIIVIGCDFDGDGTVSEEERAKCDNDDDNNNDNPEPTPEPTPEPEPTPVGE